jgi:hypothetical protein
MASASEAAQAVQPPQFRIVGLGFRMGKSAEPFGFRRSPGFAARQPAPYHHSAGSSPELTRFQHVPRAGIPAGQPQR